MADKLIAGGAWVKILADGQPIGLATGVSYDEDWAVNPANVIGFLGPIDYDSQGYSCSISMQAFIPEKIAQNPGGRTLPDGSITTISDLIPTRTEIQNQGGKPRQLDDLSLVNVSNGEVLASFRNVMIASNGVQVTPNSYVTSNVRMLAVERYVA
jgi:hypothetical protein